MSKHVILTMSFALLATGVGLEETALLFAPPSPHCLSGVRGQGRGKKKDTPILLMLLLPHPSALAPITLIRVNCGVCLLGYLENNAMPFWSVLKLKVGNTVMSLGNQSGGSTNMLTGSCGVVTGFLLESPSRYAAALRMRLARSPGDAGSKDKALKHHMDAICLLCGIKRHEANPILSAAWDEMDSAVSSAGGSQGDPILLVLPQVRFGSRDGDRGFILDVHPQLRIVYALDGTPLLSRFQLPLAGAIAIKFGASLDCEAPGNVFLDLSTRQGTCATHPFMGLTRLGDPRKVFIHRDSAISPDMFKVPQAAIDWVGNNSPGGPWLGLVVEKMTSRGPQARFCKCRQMGGRHEEGVSCTWWASGWA